MDNNEESSIGFFVLNFGTWTEHSVGTASSRKVGGEVGWVVGWRDTFIEIVLQYVNSFRFGTGSNWEFQY
jgi:hypothetical protein